MNGHNTLKRTSLVAAALAAGVFTLGLAHAGAATSAPSGRLVYTGQDGLYVQSMDGSQPARVWQAPGSGSAVSPRWSPDGTRLAFAGPDGNIWVVNADGSNAHAVTSQAVKPEGCGEAGCVTDGVRADSPRWSPDGTAISYRLAENLAHGSIWSVGLAAGATPQLLASSPDLCIFNEGWTPDRQPLFSRCASDASPSNATYLAGTSGPRPFVAGSQLAYSADGKRLAFANQSFTGGTMLVALFVAAADGSSPQLVADDGQSPSWSPAGVLAYQVAGADGWMMHVYDPAAGTDTAVGAGLLGGWTPDGSWLYFTRQDASGSTIWRVHADGSGATEVTAGDYPDWTR